MEEFINREIETHKLEDIVQSDCKVSIIFSHEGIGKSCFIEHFINEFFEDKAIIIKNKELDFVENVDKYYFADKICENICNKSDSNIISKILNMMNNSNIKPNISLTYKNWFSLNFEINNKFRLLQELIVNLLKNKKEKIVIYIDNINKIDFQSMVFINQIIDQVPNVFFILEFRLGKEEKFPTRLIEFFRNNKISYDCIELKKLNCEHLYRVMQNNNIINIDSVINEYDTFDGNLKELILMNVNKSEKRLELDKDENFILEFIDLANGQLSLNEIYKIIHSYPGSNKYFLPRHTIIDIVDGMRTKGLIDFNLSQKLYLTSLGKNYVKNSEEFLITEILSNYYIPIIIVNKSELCLQGLKILLPLLTKNADSRIKKILPSLHNNIVISKCNKKIIDDIYNNIDLNADNDEVRIELIKLYISFGDYNSAMDKIKFFIDRADDTTIVLYATLISHINSADIAEKEVEKLLSKVISKEAKSAIYTCMVALYMKIKCSYDVLDYVDKLKENNKITQLDLNIINKNISIYYNFQTANKMLNNSLSYFEVNNMNKLSIATKITLATRLAQNGDTGNACRILNEILDTDYISELDYIYAINNKAVIRMLEGDFKNIKENDLVNNYKYMQDEYSKLLIANNLLIYYCNVNDYIKAKEYADKLETVGYTRYKFESYLLLTYLNLRNYYQKINVNKISFFNQQLQTLLDDCTDDEIKPYIKSIIDGTQL